MSTPLTDEWFWRMGFTHHKSLPASWSCDRISPRLSAKPVGPGGAWHWWLSSNNADVELPKHPQTTEHAHTLLSAFIFPIEQKSTNSQ